MICACQCYRIWIWYIVFDLNLVWYNLSCCVLFLHLLPNRWCSYYGSASYLLPRWEQSGGTKTATLSRQHLLLLDGYLFSSHVTNAPRWHQQNLELLDIEWLIFLTNGDSYKEVGGNSAYVMLCFVLLTMSMLSLLLRYPKNCFGNYFFLV